MYFLEAWEKANIGDSIIFDNKVYFIKDGDKDIPDLSQIYKEELIKNSWGILEKKSTEYKLIMPCNWRIVDGFVIPYFNNKIKADLYQDDKLTVGFTYSTYSTSPFKYLVNNIKDLKDTTVTIEWKK